VTSVAGQSQSKQETIMAYGSSTRQIDVRPREDWGFFGPDSPTWRVWSSPTALIAFKRSIVVESFDPFLAIAVHEQNGVRTNPQRRLEHTLRYFLTVACGDARTALLSSQMLKRVHAKATGTEPISGKSYSANDPDAQLWIHVTGWHSNLICYERFGPGPLSAADEQRFWADCVKASELQTCDPKLVPRSREEVRAYYARVRSRLCVSEHARDLIHYFLYPPYSLTRARMWLPLRVLGAAAISTMPMWMRSLAGIRQSPALDAAIIPIARAAVRAANRPSVIRPALRMLAPSALPLMEQVMSKQAPLRDEIPTIAEARARLDVARAS
jgi:uncharacterized protein (DUF2236 family)